MLTQLNGCPERHRNKKTLSGTFLAALVIVGGIAVHFSEIPKAVLYSVFREVNRYSIAFQTRNWASLKGDHFEIRYKPEDTAIAGLVLDTAEEAVEPVNRMLGYEPRKRTLVLVYPSRGELGRSFGWAGDQSAMGVYWAGIIRILSPTAWIESAAAGDLEEEFRSSGPMVHEYAHLIVDYITRGNYPRWLTEGVAQYVEREITGFSFVSDLDVSQDGWYSLNDLEENFDTAWGQAKAYRQSLAMIDFLSERYGEEAIVGILERLGKGQNLDRAWREETGVSLEDFEQGFILWSISTDSLYKPAM